MASITTGGSTAAGTFTSSETSVNLELGVSRILAVGAATANVALTSTCRFVSLVTTAGTHVHISVGLAHRLLQLLHISFLLIKGLLLLFLLALILLLFKVRLRVTFILVNFFNNGTC